MTTRMFRPVRQVAAPGATSAVFDCILFNAVTFKFYAHNVLLRKFSATQWTHLRNAESRPDEGKSALRPLLPENSESVNIQNIHRLLI